MLVAVATALGLALFVAPERFIGLNLTAARAERAGLRVVMNRCPKIEYGRLHAELGWGGFDSKIISSKRRRL